MPRENVFVAIVSGFIIGLGATFAGYATGVHNEKEAHQKVLRQQWDAHYAGKNYLDPSKCELLSTPDSSEYWYECKSPKGGFK